VTDRKKGGLSSLAGGKESWVTYNRGGKGTRQGVGDKGHGDSLQCGMHKNTTKNMPLLFLEII
jgi:hypothetical protein